MAVRCCSVVQNRGYETVVMGARVSETGKGTIYRNSGTSIPFDSFPVFESGEIVIGRVFRSCVQVVVGDRNLNDLKGPGVQWTHQD